MKREESEHAEKMLCTKQKEMEVEEEVDGATK
jgi:hypothetical protein